MNNDIKLGINSKKVLKIIHIILAACVFGSLSAILSILIIKQNYNLGDTPFAADLSMVKIFSSVTTYGFFGLLITAAVYGLFTEWGFVNFKWIIAKIVTVLVMTVVTVVLLGPSINGMASISDAGLNTTSMSAEYLSFGKKAIAYASIDLLLLVFTYSVSVAKPWGRTGLKLKQKTAVIVLLPIILIGLAFGAFNNIKQINIRKMPIGSIDLSSVSDGVHNGAAKVGGFVYKVKVEVKDHKITNIEAYDNRKSPYVTYAEGVFSKIIKNQKADVDAVTGATTTSKAFMKAVENAVNVK